MICIVSSFGIGQAISLEHNSVCLVIHPFAPNLRLRTVKTRVTDDQRRGTGNYKAVKRYRQSNRQYISGFLYPAILVQLVTSW